MNGPFGSMMTSLWPMGSEWAIVSLVVLMLATGALVVAAHRNRSLDGPPRTG
jgi:hypothetical protein